MKFSRLVEILILLLGRKSITAGELAEHFGVSVRTIYRDVDALSASGVPVYMSKGYGGGISLLEEFTLSKTYLSHEEQDELLFALQTLKATDHPDADAALQKLTSLFRREKTDWVEIDYSSWGPSSLRPSLEQIKVAILGRKRVGFWYINARNERGEKLVEPNQLLFRENNWYLRGLDVEKEAPRLYKLYRMSDFTITDQPCTLPLPPDEKAENNVQGPEIQLRLLFSPTAEYRVWEHYPAEHITKQPDGSLLVNTRFIHDNWVYGHLLSFGPEVEVLEPQSLRQELGEMIEKMARLYI